ncbi:hypothetical protein [Streptomyces alkaliterrae]|uniref:Uncharacterized protein n=1 Tax=Streptomyces alkaliterrae TaxID=2213162 RepID=A0A5P0YZV7_9ACTN|nr:hypothetical protein [Streptomyces alkaliterrae]MBB1260898.1 hypothetical protein [Streptomyces alkaliterrae]MQS04379.1 hypothetical protein [Streptomyces alkaliterrae]
MHHWHAYGYTGHEIPPDSQARDDDRPVMPRELDAWFRKPKTMLAGTYHHADEAYAWLAKELGGHTPAPGGLPVAQHLEHAHRVLQLGQDAYIGYYEPGRIVVRTLLTCPRGRERCPDPRSA